MWDDVWVGYMTQMPLRISSGRRSLQESSVYQDIIAKGIELGRKEAAIEGILTILEVRFQATPTAIKPALEAIDDLQRFKSIAP